MRFILLLLPGIALILFLSFSSTWAQSDVLVEKKDLLRVVSQSNDTSQSGFYRFYTHFNRGSDTLPFWLYANRHGLIRPGSSNNFITGFAGETKLTPDHSSSSFRLGTELVNRFSDLDNTLHFQQLYGTAQYRKLKLRAGRFYRMNDFDASLEGLTTGFFVESHNATPYPRISLETDGFAEVPKTGGGLLIRFRYSEGLLESDRTISSPYIHHKSLQLRAAFNRLSIQMGIFHSVIWTGIDEEHGQLPRGFDDYMRVVFSRSAAEDSGVNISEKLNRLGNTIGVYEAGFTYQASHLRIVGYRHLFLEDELSVKLQSPWDGIWGLGLIRNEKKSPVRAIVYEHMNSIRQESRKGLAQGRASFYNHGIYTDGWSYHGRLMGNPLFTFDPEERDVFNNVMIAHHVGATGDLSRRVSYRTMLTFSRNYGVCEDQIITGRCGIMPGERVPDDYEIRPRGELREDRTSALIEFNILLNTDHNLKLHTSFAADAGEFWDRRFGFMAGFSIGN